MTKQTSADWQRQLSQFTQRIKADDAAIPIYPNNFQAIKRNAIDLNFPVTKDLLGHKVFVALAQVYGQYFSSDHWDINLYGDQFDSLIRSQNKSSKADYFAWSTLADISALEYALVQAYYGVKAIRIKGVEWPERDTSQTTTFTPPPSKQNLYRALLVANPFLQATPDLDLSKAMTICQFDQRLFLQNAEPHSV
jgi:hypothetical protein